VGEGVDDDPPLVLLVGLPEVLPETRAESLESLTKDAVMVAFLHALGGSMDPATKLAAMHCFDG
jgi:hypothetical protein